MARRRCRSVAGARPARPRPRNPSVRAPSAARSGSPCHLMARDGFGSADRDARRRRSEPPGDAMATATAPGKDVMGRLEDARPLDPAVKAVRTVINKLLGPQAVRDVLHGVWFGHPLHPVLTDVPIGA